MDNKVKSKVTDQVIELEQPEQFISGCPLCRSDSTKIIHQDSHSKVDRPYLLCSDCDLIFVPRLFHLSPSQEKAIYDCHENNPNDLGYRKFLSRLTTPLIQHLKTGAEGLDFGCGPGPTLSVMLREAGFNVSEYDPFYSPDTAALTKKFDFVTSTEVVEHLSDPEKIFNKLFGLLKPQGVLGIMTKRPPERGIVNWHYTKDPTHITFYSIKTFEFIASKYNCELEVVSDDTVILLKRD